MAAGDTLTNALIGAAVAAVLFVVPFSPALGGGVAGSVVAAERTG